MVHQFDEYVFYSRFGGADHGVGEALPGQLAGERRSIEPVGGDQVVRLAERVAFADPAEWRAASSRPYMSRPERA